MRKKKMILSVSILILFSMLLFGCGRRESIGDLRIIAGDDSMQDASQEETLTQEEAEKESSDQQDTSVPIADPTMGDGEDDEKEEEQISAALHVEGTSLLNEDGELVQLRGLSTHGLAWFPQYVNKETFREFRDKGNINVIRLAMYAAENGGYCTGGDKERLKQVVRDGVEYATELGMYTIIDWHVVNNRPGDYLTEALAFFDEMSEDYCDYDNVIYEICNEPGGSWSEIKAYAIQVIDAIRANDEDAVILVGTPNYCQAVDQAAADPIEGYDNIMYTLHFYAASHREELRERMKNAVSDGLPVFVSEFGICDASGNGAINESEARVWLDAMDELGISYVAWNISNKNETSAILRSSCNKRYDFSESDLSASGAFLAKLSRQKSAAVLAGKSSDTGINKNTFSKKENNETSKEKPEKDKTTTETEKKSDSIIRKSNGEGLSVTVELVNSWESDGKGFYQYNVAIENSSDADVDGWEITLKFSGEIALSDGWNGKYAVEGNTLTISNVDYNGTIAAGKSIHDIGFIISGTTALKLTSEG